eukprot:Em0011g734a
MDQCAEFRRPAALVPNQGALPEGGKRREHKPQRIAEKSSNSVEATSRHVTSMPLPVGRPSARNPSNYRCADEVQMTVVSGAADEPDREHLYTQIKDPPLIYDDSEYVKMTANCSTDEYVEMKGGVSEDDGWNAGPVQLLAFGSIGVELAGLSCKGCCTCVVTQDGMAEKIMSSASSLCPIQQG